MDGSKVRYGPQDALKLLDGVTKFVACRGKTVDVFHLKKQRPADDVLLAKLIGPTGNLRAPTIRVGKTLIVGFNAEAWREAFGA